ncbi:MAG: DNA internalization-related competence protein ComEC/Rec2, partial [Gammaproteobacteria bacterium]|nr:DNA internalization-related competence protein ComEC/Rec2 [Gammaproteobacteria bacterium]
AEFCLLLVSYLLEFLWLIMSYLANLPFAQWNQFSPITWTLVPGVVGVMLLLAPKGFPARFLAIFFLLPLFLVKPEKPEEDQFNFTLLDVGQGLSAVVQTQNHLLVFDTGPRFSSGFDTGDAVVLPFLRSIAVDKIDVIIISHGDNDHIGGLQSLLKNVPVEEILTSVPELISNHKSEACLANRRWEWDGVLFEIINPQSLEAYGRSRKSGNNRSCVLRVSSGDNAVLLTGDIEKPAEKNLLKNNAEILASTILVAPHHGSNTSSTSAFIQQISPDYVFYPSGYRNRFGFPKQKVRDRYRQYGIKEAVTSNTGAINILMDRKSIEGPFFFRETVRRFWHQ